MPDFDVTLRVSGAPDRTVNVNDPADADGAATLSQEEASQMLFSAGFGAPDTTFVIDGNSRSYTYIKRIADGGGGPPPPPPPPADVRRVDSPIMLRGITLRYGGVPALPREKAAFLVPGPFTEPYFGYFNAGGDLEVRVGDLRLIAGYTYHRFPLDRRPPDMTNRHQIKLGMAGTKALFGNNHYGLDFDRESALVLSFDNHDHAENDAGAYVSDFHGPSVRLNWVSISGGIIQKSLIAGSSDNMPKYSLEIGLRLTINLESVDPEEEDSGEAQARRLVTAGFGLLHASRVHELVGSVGGIDGVRSTQMIEGVDQDLLFGALLGGLNDVNVQLSLSRLYYHVDNRTAALIASWLSFLGGAALEIGGIASNDAQMAGVGANLACAGAVHIPTTFGAEGPWPSRISVGVCGLGQIAIGAGILASSSDPDRDAPIQRGSRDANPDSNPHLDTSQENKRSVGIRLISSGVGGVGAFALFTTEF